MTKQKTVKRKDLMNIAMVNGNEEKYSKVIIEGVVKEWIGFGWIEIDDEPDPEKYPTMVD